MNERVGSIIIWKVIISGISVSGRSIFAYHVSNRIRKAKHNFCVLSHYNRNDSKNITFAYSFIHKSMIAAITIGKCFISKYNEWVWNVISVCQSFFLSPCSQQMTSIWTEQKIQIEMRIMQYFWFIHCVDKIFARIHTIHILDMSLWLLLGIHKHKIFEFITIWTALERLIFGIM